MNVVDFLSRELEEIEEGIELASDPDRPAVALLPKWQCQKLYVEHLIRKAEADEFLRAYYDVRNNGQEPGSSAGSAAVQDVPTLQETLHQPRSE